MGKGLGDLFGGSSKSSSGSTSVSSSAPPWLDELGASSADKFKEWMGKQEAYTPYPQQENPYAGYQSLFGGTSGPDYLESFSAAPKAAYNQALTDTKNMFGAKGLYGSVGNPMMSGAMASAGQNYATSMADAQQKAQNAQVTDFLTGAKGQEWANQNALNAAQYQNTMNQQVIQNYLSSLGIASPNIMSGQVVQQDTSDGKSGLGSLLGGAGSLAGAYFSDQNKKEGISEPGPVLEKVMRLDIKKYRYKPEFQEASGSEPTKHYGPMAQQWAEIFGGNGIAIDYQDVIGVLLAAVQELSEEIASLRRE